MNCLIIDDQLLSRAVLKEMIALDQSLKLVGECTNALDALKELQSNKIDLVFTDIAMPGMSGMELAERLKGTRPLIIFTTSLPQYAVDAFNLNVVDFLVKPIGASSFLKAVEKAKVMFSLTEEQANVSRNSEFIFIRVSNTLKSIKTSEIFYLEAKGDHVKFYLQDQIYSIHSTLISVEQKLPVDVFFRVHRSFIINLNKIDKIEGGTLIINKQLVPIANAYRTALYKRLQIV
ncbi:MULTISPECIES: LytR/AlgR family response regulator transcription factor [unclassified Sphingobacterium]|uniref:LytR/AlgR family response regulator transcription factor n=1 Tax=unclassified Sphingobacterium TaxID=2609468 RepID=UPI0025EA3655|nr:MULTISPECIES: LytTR family DNA-binding domain-containing protein [unclassified Sphingobacterium]